MSTLDELQRRLMSRRPQKTKTGSILPHVPEIECADGFTMSVQASLWHYCSPKADVGPWSAVEVGFPSEPEPLLGQTAPTENVVYGWVPIKNVAAVIDKHGGFKSA